MESCPEFARLTRRGLLRGAAAGAGVMAAGATFGTAFVETSYAATRSAPAVMVVLSLRGACDGLSLVVPHGDPVYYAARPRIAVPADTLLARDGMFGLHPMLAPLLPLWDSGRMAAVHATGLPVRNRSHFAAMEELEDADPGSDARVGWLNRLIARDTYTHPMQGLQLGSASVPTSLLGPAAAASARSVEGMRLAGGDAAGRRSTSLATTWGAVDGPLGEGGRAALEVVGDFATVAATPAAPAGGAVYPAGDLGAALAAAARTIKADVGAEVITVDHGSWDHHASLGTPAWGELRTVADELARAVAAFFADLGDAAGKVTLVTVSEFGRRVRENASLGLDHGHGNVMLLMGAGVRGGYHGQWPGLTDTADADLTVTRDYRSVLGEVVSRRFGASTAAVFPGVAMEHVGAMA
jgi:uncharacterized protein (DUF1501 family)